MPSENDIKSNGQNLGEINSNLLKTEEELTLHLIKKDKQLTAQELAIQILSNKIQKLDRKIEDISRKLK